MEVDVRVARDHIRQLRNQRRGIALRRIPFAAERTPDTGRERSDHGVIGIIVIEWVPKNPQTTGPLTPGPTVGPA